MADTSILLRWVLIIFMAFFIAVILDSPDRNVRLVAVIFLIIFAQIREHSLINDAISGAQNSSGDKKKSEEKEIPAKKMQIKSVFDQNSTPDIKSMREFANSYRKSRSSVSNFSSDGS